MDHNSTAAYEPEPPHFHAVELLPMEPALCCVCGIEDVEPVAVGDDFEYRACADSFLAVRCRHCAMVFLNPRPASAAMARIYPDTYHAFQFDAQEFGFIHRVRQRLEARRLLKWCRGLPADARILDVGCGDGFHLSLLRDYGPATWTLEGIDADERAVKAAHARGLSVQQGFLESLAIDDDSYDLILLVMTIEHVAEPKRLLEIVHSKLKRGGKVVIVTDNSAAPDGWIFRGRHWGGYHFPRHLYLFNRDNLAQLANAVGLKSERVRTAMSPVNWVYSIRNLFDDWGFPLWLVRQFSLKKAVPLAAFTVVDSVFNVFGRGSILHAIFVKPTETQSS